MLYNSMTEDKIIYYINKLQSKRINRTRPQTQRVANALIKQWNGDYVLEYISQFNIKNYNKLALTFCKYWEYKSLAYNLWKFHNLKKNLANILISNWYKENIWAYLDSFEKLPKKNIKQIFNQ
jgi:hypothetical protein